MLEPSDPGRCGTAQWSAVTEHETDAVMSALYELSQEYGEHAETTAVAQRGRWFNDFLARLLNLYGIRARSDQFGLDRRDEIDVAFRLGAHAFIVEAKWTAEPVDIGPVAKLCERLRVRPAGAYGVLVSMAGYTAAVLERARREPDILLLDRAHIDALVAGVISPAELFDGLLEHTGVRGGARAPLPELLRGLDRPVMPPWTPVTPVDGQDPVTLAFAAPGATVKALFTMADPWFTPWTGMVRDGETLLLTCSAGIVRFDPETGAGAWEHPVPGCHGPVLRHAGDLLAVRGHGVLALDGQGSAFGGPLGRGARLVPGGEVPCAFATTGPPGPVYRGGHRLTRLAGAVGRDHSTQIEFTGQINQVALLPGGRLYIVGGSYAGVVDPAESPIRLPRKQWFDAAPLVEASALHVLNDRQILSVGRDGPGAHVEIHLTDLHLRKHTLLLRVAAGSYPRALVPGREAGVFHLLVDMWGNASAPRSMLLEVALPIDAT